MSLTNKLRVLVVDNDRVSRKILTYQVKALGVETQEAESGKEAVELFAGGSEFDLVLIETEMPIMDGYEAAWQIRTMRGIAANPKIVGVTGDPTRWGKKGFEESGGNGYYPKPMYDDKLQALLFKVALDRCQKAEKRTTSSYKLMPINEIVTIL